MVAQRLRIYAKILRQPKKTKTNRRSALIQVVLYPKATRVSTHTKTSEHGRKEHGAIESRPNLWQKKLTMAAISE